MRVRSTFFPLNSNLPMAQAAATPTTRLKGTAIAATSSVRRIAESASGSASAAMSAPRPCRNASMKTTRSGMNRKPTRKSPATAMRRNRTRASSVVIDSRDRGFESAISDIAELPSAPGLELVDEEEEDEGDREHHGCDHRGSAIIELLEPDDDEEWRNLRHHGDVAGDEYAGAVLADAARESEGETGEERREHVRQDHVEDCPEPASAEKGRGLLNVLFRLLEYRLNGA